LRNREIDRLYEHLSEEGKEVADYFYETGKELRELSDEEEQAAFARAVARLQTLSIEDEDRSLMGEISRLRVRMYYARAEEFTH
jgi:hypothetical protein